MSLEYLYSLFYVFKNCPVVSFCTSEKMSKKINEKFNALCVDMEGASIAQVAYLSGVPFLVVRSISDIPNNNNKITYEEFLEESSKMVAKFLLSMIEKISLDIK